MRAPALAVSLAALSVACQGSTPVDPMRLVQAEKASDTARLVADLEAIAAWHRDHGTGMEGHLGPPAPAGSIEEALAARKLHPTAELLALWSWHDGETSEHPFVWYHDFLPVDEAMREHASLRRNPMIAWDREFVPVLSFEGEWYATRSSPDHPAAGPVFHFTLEDGPRIAYTNLTSMMATMRECLWSGAVKWDPAAQAMVEDVAAVSAIHRRHNPGLRFPYHVAPGP